jgi:hypothetical protein
MPRPTAEEHRSWAQQNEAFYNHLRSGDEEWPGWPMTVLFYVAVHEVLAFLVERGVRPGSHEATRRMLRAKAEWTRLGAMYEQFLGYSRDARYRCVDHGEPQLTLAESLLAQIRSEVASLSGPRTA